MRFVVNAAITDHGARIGRGEAPMSLILRMRRFVSTIPAPDASRRE
ncbi:MAG: hypothetical protein ACYC2H_01665 [Thermoplasmatota archaeon]